MGINDVRGKSRATGSLTINLAAGPYDAQGEVTRLLRKEYPEADQRVFNGIIPSLAEVSANTFERKRFRKAVEERLLGVAKLIHPDAGYNEKSSYSVIYNVVATFIKERDEKIVAYRNHK